MATVVNVASGEGALFPSPSGGDYFALVLGDGTFSGPYEVTYCTSRTGDALTVTRAQEGTTALAWIAGSRASNLMTAGTMETIQTAASGQQQSGNYATDSGTANALVITLSPAPASLADLVGAPVRVLKIASANTGPATIDINSLGPEAIKHADGTDVGVGELPASGLFEFIWDGTNVILQSRPQLEVKAWVIFHWTGAAVSVTASYNVSGVSRAGTGHYQAQLSGGLNYTHGYASVTGVGPNPATAGSIGMGSAFSGTNPLVDAYFGDAGGSGGQASDPLSSVSVTIFGITS